MVDLAPFCVHMLKKRVCDVFKEYLLKYSISTISSHVSIINFTSPSTMLTWPLLTISNMVIDHVFLGIDLPRTLQKVNSEVIILEWIRCEENL